MTVAVSPNELKHNPPMDVARADVAPLQPAMSPNVFAALKAAVAGYPCPTVVETGIGISTYHLCEQLRTAGGTYVGIESNRGWWSIVEAWIARLLTAHAKQAPLEQVRRIWPLQPRHYPKPLLAMDSTFRAGALTAILRLRQPTGLTGDGTAEELDDYIQAVEGPAQVVIVDGRARLPILDRIVERGILAPGGLLFVHDARSFREVLTARFPGGRFLDGEGGFTNAFRPERAPIPHVPQEAYFWTAPRGPEDPHAR